MVNQLPSDRPDRPDQSDQAEQPDRSGPPRPIGVGDVVATFCEALGEWSAAQITDVDADLRSVAVLELDWSGPEPMTVADLGEVRALRLTHHSHTGRLSHCNVEWVLPRSYKVVGTLPLVEIEKCANFAQGWRVGLQAFMQRRWDAGDENLWYDPHQASYTGEKISALLADSGDSIGDIRRLMIREIDALDGERLAGRFPNLDLLVLSGSPGTLSRASGLNRLAGLKSLTLSQIFGLDGSDCLRPADVPELEYLRLDSIPAEYAAAMRAVWQPKEAEGVFVQIIGEREAGWFEENRVNPFRDWPDEPHIDEDTYEAVLALYRETKESFLGLVSDAPEDSSDPDEEMTSKLFELGQHYGERLNELDESVGFIMTIEAEQLCDALYDLVDEAGVSLGRDVSWASEHLVDGVDSVRDW